MNGEVRGGRKRGGGHGRTRTMVEEFEAPVERKREWEDVRGVRCLKKMGWGGGGHEALREGRIVRGREALRGGGG